MTTSTLWARADAEELKRVTEVLAAMSEGERVDLVRLIDGPPRRQSQERASEPRLLPSTSRGDVRVRVTVNGA